MCVYVEKRVNKTSVVRIFIVFTSYKNSFYEYVDSFNDFLDGSLVGSITAKKYPIIVMLLSGYRLFVF